MVAVPLVLMRGLFSRCGRPLALWSGIKGTAVNYLQASYGASEGVELVKVGTDFLFSAGL